MEARTLLDPNGKTVLRFGSDSPNAISKLVTVCIHGDETAGMIAANELIQEGFFDSLDENVNVTVMIGNPRAVNEKKRFIDMNLNRVFTRQLINASTRFDTLSKDLYELSRLDAVAEQIKKADQLLDLHTTSAPTKPFAIVSPRPQSEEVAKHFPISFVLQNVVSVINGTTLDYADMLEKAVAVCVECGQHKERSSVDCAKRTIQCFVTGYCDKSPKEVLFVDKSEILRAGFRFSRTTKAFDRVNYNELVACDNVVGEIRCPYPDGAFLIMPIANPVLGEEAWLWGTTNTLIK
jgi:succinylglutamate desuccinylase